jgi:hypothetical protein
MALVRTPAVTSNDEYALPYPSCTNAVFGLHLKRVRSLAISKVQNRAPIGHSRLREEPRSP